MHPQTQWLHGALAITALVLASWATLEKPTSNDGNTGDIILPTYKLQGVQWQEERYNVSLNKILGEDQALSVSVTKKTSQDNPDGLTPAPMTLHPTKTYPGSQAAQDLFAAMMPFRAIRTLGNVVQEAYKELGLEEKTSSLTLRDAKGEHHFVVGAATYGSGHRYVLAPKGQVFLVKSKSLSGLRHGAGGLLERKAFPFEHSSIRKASIITSRGQREFSHRHANDKKKSFFADPGAPDDKLDHVTNWLDRILKLRISDLSQEQPSGKPELRVQFFDAQHSLGSLELWHPDKDHAKARSTGFDTTVTLSKVHVEGIIRDVETLFEDDN
jgi:hypothetical protein